MKELEEEASDHEDKKLVYSSEEAERTHCDSHRIFNEATRRSFEPCC